MAGERGSGAHAAGGRDRVAGRALPLAADAQRRLRGAGHGLGLRGDAGSARPAGGGAARGGGSGVRRAERHHPPQAGGRGALRRAVARGAAGRLGEHGAGGGRQPAWRDHRRRRHAGRDRIAARRPGRWCWAPAARRGPPSRRWPMAAGMAVAVSARRREAAGRAGRCAGGEAAGMAAAAAGGAGGERHPDRPVGRCRPSCRPASGCCARRRSSATSPTAATAARPGLYRGPGRRRAGDRRPRGAGGAGGARLPAVDRRGAADRDHAGSACESHID